MQFLAQRSLLLKSRAEELISKYTLVLFCGVDGKEFMTVVKEESISIGTAPKNSDISQAVPIIQGFQGFRKCFQGP